MGVSLLDRPLLMPDELHDLSMSDIYKYGFPRKILDNKIRSYKRRNLPNLYRGLKMVAKARALGIPHFYGALYGVVHRGNGDVEDYGLISLRVVTTAGVNFIVDAFQNILELENMKFHGLGTGVNAEAIGDVALQTELTTQYNPDSTRATGSLTEGVSANIFRTVGTNAFDASANITEHGVFSQAATGGGTLLDRSVFTAFPFVSGDGFTTTYDFTCNAGS